ncbi:hypothetical protein [Streptomyces sp. NRRL F-5135]|uniref:hypothetical protein n=1 Tax=Streptomyces sp. NRRL F-5135 TaxID=1463858 RepID=UPI0004C8D04D|nr:hypothetical protein [Streptomyces sp. NRRL F-5135]
MGHEAWTVDRLHHALPHSALRQQLLHDVNLTPIEALPAALDRWTRVVEQLENEAPGIEAARTAAKVGHLLPSHLTAPGAGVTDRTSDILHDAAARRRGQGAA